MLETLPSELLLAESSASAAFENKSSSEVISLLSLSRDFWLCLVLPVLGRVIFTVLSFMEDDSNRDLTLCRSDVFLGGEPALLSEYLL